MKAALALTEARHLVIHGRVQGVGFRYHMTCEAHRLGMTGWVRNRHEGTVEALIIGTTEQVAALLAWSHTGPPLSRVDRIEVDIPSSDQLAEAQRHPEGGFVQRIDA